MRIQSFGILILFGSLSKAEAKPDSDIDLAIIANEQANLSGFRKILNREVQVFWYKSFGDIRNKELANSIVSGYALKGRLKL